MKHDEVCVECRAGWHRLCSHSDVALAGGEDWSCCCEGRYSTLAHLRELELDDAVHAGQLEGAAAAAGALYALEHGGETPAKAPRGKPSTPAVQGPPPGEEPLAGGDSGYIHPDAWASTAVIGSLADPSSTGRKRVDRMFPIQPGQVCDWARLRDCGGGPRPIVGCIGNPASDLHHGPDKNTLNNAKVSRGVGTIENVHAICSECHNAWHAANDPLYPPYDRVAQQAEPWLPFTQEPWGPQTPSTASPAELWDQEQERERQRAERGRKHRGRNAGARGGDVDVRDDDE